MVKTEEFEIPDEWGLSERQEVVIGSLIDARGAYIPAFELCNALYVDDAPYKRDDSAPAKLRVLMQRCRQIVDDLSAERTRIAGKRGKGWRITMRERIYLITATGD